MQARAEIGFFMQMFSIVMSILIHVDETISLRFERHDTAIVFQ